MKKRDIFLATFEMDAENVEPMIPEDGVLVHTNHFLGPKTYLANDVNHLGSSYIRLQRIKALIKQHYGTITVEDVQKMLSDHAGFPYSICYHEDLTYPPTRRYATNFSIIMDLTGNCLYIAAGNPCENEYEKYHI